MIRPDGTFSPFAPGTILQDPNGLAFLPELIGGVGSVFVADTGTGNIWKFTKAGGAETFATFGNPNFLAFERGFILLPDSDPHSKSDAERNANADPHSHSARQGS